MIIRGSYFQWMCGRLNFKSHKLEKLQMTDSFSEVSWNHLLEIVFDYTVNWRTSRNPLSNLKKKTEIFREVDILNFNYSASWYHKYKRGSVSLSWYIGSSSSILYLCTGPFPLTALPTLRWRGAYHHKRCSTDTGTGATNWQPVLRRCTGSPPGAALVAGAQKLQKNIHVANVDLVHQETTGRRKGACQVSWCSDPDNHPDKPGLHAGMQHLSHLPSARIWCRLRWQRLTLPLKHECRTARSLLCGTGSARSPGRWPVGGCLVRNITSHAMARTRPGPSRLPSVRAATSSGGVARIGGGHCLCSSLHRVQPIATATRWGQEDKAATHWSGQPWKMEPGGVAWCVLVLRGAWWFLVVVLTVWLWCVVVVNGGVAWWWYVVVRGAWCVLARSGGGALRGYAQWRAVVVVRGRRAWCAVRGGAWFAVVARGGGVRCGVLRDGKVQQVEVCVSIEVESWGRVVIRQVSWKGGRVLPGKASSCDAGFVLELIVLNSMRVGMRSFGTSETKCAHDFKLPWGGV